MDQLSATWDWLSDAAQWSGPDGIPTRVTEHLWISLVAMVAASVAALPLALLLGHVKRGGLLAAAVVNVGRAVPTFSIIALLFPISLSFGLTENLGFWPTAVALVLLAIPPMFTNAYTGVRDVEPAVVEAARGMGLRPRDVLWRVEAPAALPLILTGVRVSAVQVVATATLGAWFGFGGLGSYLFVGSASNRDDVLIGGAILVAALALIVDLAFGLLQRATTPWLATGRRRARRTAPDSGRPDVVAQPTGP